jgi:SagB-type dehydrogenase family enzyme
MDWPGRMIMRKSSVSGIMVGLAAIVIAAGILCIPDESVRAQDIMNILKLPEPDKTGGLPLSICMSARRSVRSYGSRSLTLNEVSQLLWAAQGITSESGGRTAPSAGALYPLEIYLVAGNVRDLAPGVYRYEPRGHQLRIVSEGDARGELQAAALNQKSIGSAAIDIVITAIPSITEVKYGDRTERYIDIEVGAVAQNVYLMCESLGLGAVAMGAFEDIKVGVALGTDAEPRLIIPVGVKK